MTFKEMITRFRALWQSRPLAVLLPLAATVWYWWTHGHDLHSLRSLPNWQEVVAGTALLTTKWERVTEMFLPPVPPAPPTPPVQP